MARTHKIVVVELEPLDDPATGIWCPTCALPSGVAAHFVLALDGAPQKVILHSWCTQCRQELQGLQ
jgi:hypothetical protein